ncbi:MAG TPA: ATP-binding protein, partial [Arcobacter sp.]|nr:ATP-binding protein [Arcobacter sp.]
SANFDLVDIDLSKDVFFLGDNASGKTTTTRAIHYLYNAEGRQLGIPSDKDSFEKYYFPYDNSYIVYVFDDFFMMAFKRSGKVQKWFSKQPFDLERVIVNGTLAEHDRIRAYLKDVSSYRPQTNAEYRKIIYGQERRYLDFSIASIKNYDAFLEVYNMVFNVDKAIVDMKSIKKAIQKSLQKDDEILSLDFDTYITDMTAFKRDYDFFKKFDRQRDNIKKAVGVMEELVTLEETIQLLLGKIRYNQEMDKEKLPGLKAAYEMEEETLKAFKRRVKHWEKRLENLQDKVSNTINELRFKIKELEALEEKYSPIHYEEAVTIAAKKNGLEKDRDDLTISIRKLEEEQSSIVKEIENRIEQLTRKIDVDILAEGREKLRALKESEENQCDNDIASIEAEFLEIFLEIEKKIEVLQNALSLEEENIETLKNSYESQTDDSSGEYEVEQEKNSIEQEKTSNQISNKESEIDRLSRQIIQEERKVEGYKNEYLQARFERAEKLNSVRLYNNTKIKEYQTLLSHEPHTLKAFLAEEVDGWEENIYPVIDKELLSKSCEVLKPVVDFKSTSTLFGVTMDLTSLDAYPTAEELHEKIVQHKEDRKISLVKAREEDRVLKADYDHFLNVASLKIDNIKSEIKLEQDNLGVLQVKLSELKQEQIQRKERYQDNKEKLKEQFELQKKKHV